MVQRLVDIIDHNDAEHEYYALSIEEACPIHIDTEVRPKEWFTILTAETIGLPIGGLLMSQHMIEPNQLQPIGPYEQPMDLAVDDRFSAIQFVRFPSSTVEDLAIIDNVPGI